MKNPDGLLMIEPTCAPTVPLIDDLTRKATALRRAVADPKTQKRYRTGMHQCTGMGCESNSDSVEHELTVGGLVVQTNSLIVHYVACHRSDVDDVERAKIEKMFRDLGLVEQTPTTREVTGTIIRTSSRTR